MKTILRITCYIISVLACIAVVGLATSSGTRRALMHVLPERPPEPAAGAEEEAEEERHALALSDRALKNIGITEQSAPAVALTDYEKTIAFPGTLVERPGRSSLTIPSPMAGVISKVYRVPGESLHEGDPLFDIRFTDEELIRNQTELLSLYLKRDIVEKEIARLEPLAIVTEHCRLYVEGRAYASDQRLLERALTNDSLERLLSESPESAEARAGVQRAQCELAEQCAERIMQTSIDFRFWNNPFSGKELCSSDFGT